MVEETRRCRRCRAPVADTARYCSHCGARVGGPPTPPILKILSAVGLGFAAVWLGGAGVCFLTLGIGGGAGSGFQVLMVAAGVAMLFALVRMLR